MKIAFEKKLPDPESFFQLMNAGMAGESEKSEANEKYARLQCSGRVVAAYDGDTLVAVGGLEPKDIQDTEFGGEWSATVRSDYANRDLETNMKKLLVHN